MTDTVLFIHGMFQNAKSWDGWVQLFRSRGYDCIAESWPLHDGEPLDLRMNPPLGLGDLRLQTVIDRYVTLIQSRGIRPIVIGHSVGGLITQKLAEQDLIAAGVPIASVAPNRMLAFDWGFFRNSVTITNPVAGDSVFEMTPDGFHKNFANTVSRAASDAAFDATATHDSRNVLRDCMLGTGDIELEKVRTPLLFIAAADDQICPAELCRKNSEAYQDKSNNLVECREFTGRGHFICGQPGWEEVANDAADWLDSKRGAAAM